MTNKDYLTLIFECFSDHKRYFENHILRQVKKAEEMGVPEYEFFDRLLFAVKTLVWRIKEKAEKEKRRILFKLEKAIEKGKAESEINEIQNELLNFTHIDEIPLPVFIADAYFPDLPELFMNDLAVFEMDIKNVMEERKVEAEKSEAEKEQHEPEIQDSGFRLTKGKKADLLRVLNALYELNFFADKDNNTKKVQFMKAFGKLINEDFSNYDSDLSQAYRAKHEANLQIFDNLIKKTTDIYNEKLDKTN